VKSMIEVNRLTPVMALLRLSDDPASGYYVQNIIKHGNRLGCEVRPVILNETITSPELLAIIQKYNSDNEINGVMIQKPLPRHIDGNLIDNAVYPEKDIDGINPVNLGRLFLEQDAFAPCTAEAVIETMKYYGIETEGRQTVILGRSAVVGKPLAGLLLHKKPFGNATVTVCHSKSANLNEVIQSADILVAAIGKANYVTNGMISENTVCLDVGINAVPDAEKGTVYVGDVDYNSCYNKALAISPVPGGIGSVTTAVLFRNLVKAALMQKSKKNS
jgi:methylenetetrahydrofolate dehydrogenase (NADP+)/methenyltetrahydrofolate cyclohydrolase